MNIKNIKLLLLISLNGNQSDTKNPCINLNTNNSIASNVTRVSLVFLCIFIFKFLFLSLKNLDQKKKLHKKSSIGDSEIHESFANDGTEIHESFANDGTEIHESFTDDECIDNDGNFIQRIYYKKQYSKNNIEPQMTDAESKMEKIKLEMEQKQKKMMTEMKSSELPKIQDVDYEYMDKEYINQGEILTKIIYYNDNCIERYIEKRINIGKNSDNWIIIKNYYRKKMSENNITKLPIQQ